MEPEGSLTHSQLPTTCPYPEPARSSPYLTSHFMKIQLNVILPFTPGFSKWSLSGFLTETLYTPLLSTIGVTCSVHLILLVLITWIIFSEKYRSLIHQYVFFSIPFYLVPLRPKYSPQHPIPKHPQPTFLLQCDRPSFTSIQNNRQNYSSIYLNL